MAYEGFYIRKKGEDKIYETGQDFDMYVSSTSVLCGAVSKPLYSVDWSDEDGLDEFIPDCIPVQQGSMSCSFSCKGSKKDLPSKILSFVDFLRRGEMDVYDKYYNIGKRGVRFSSLSDNAVVYEDSGVKNEGNGSDFCSITITVEFKVNQPLSNIVLAE